MFEKSAPRDYVTGDYLDYQEKHARNMRESDRRLLQLMAENLGRDRRGEILDIGCSNGNLLLHLESVFPELRGRGIDLYEKIIEHCRQNPALSRHRFQVGDARDLNFLEDFEAVVANAVLHRFDAEHYDLCLDGIARALKSGGYFFAFDWFSPFSQQLKIFESSRQHPEGLTLWVRPRSWLEEKLSRRGFDRIAFEAFDMPFDLPRSGDADCIDTYTVTDREGRRLCFRGALFEPWCFVAARKT
jgi:SAM-dependent methyltransferase